MATGVVAAEPNNKTSDDLMGSRSSLRASVVIPVLNGAGIIGRALAALEAQTTPLRDFEVIVVDDGSTDGTAETVRAWATAHPRLQVRVVRQTNSGPAAARNHGAHVARSNLLLYTDADCIPQPGWVEAFLGTFEATDAPAAAMGTYLCRQTTPAARFAQLEFEERYALMTRHAHSIDLIATYSAAYKRDLFLAMGGFDSRFPKANNEDVDFSYRLSATGHAMHFVPAAQVEHEHDATWPGYFRTKMSRGFWRMVVYRRYPEKSVKDTYTPQLLKAQLPLALLALLGGVFALLRGRLGPLMLGMPFLASTRPMIQFARQHAPGVAPWVPFGAFVRALAFVAGVAKALISGGDALRAEPVTLSALAENPAIGEVQP